MLSFETAMLEQRNLERLCSDRKLSSIEIFPPNSYYGNDYILKKYAGIKKSYSLKATIPHGVILGSKAWGYELRSNNPVALTFDIDHMHSINQFIAQNRIKKKVILSASPILYLRRLMQKRNSGQSSRKGTIIFPSHSTHHITATSEYGVLARRVTELPDELHPVTVCIYWKDYLLGHHVPFKEQGLEVVSAGHMYDPNFLFRFWHLCSLHKYSCGNALGSSAFYSVVAGCSFFQLRNAPPIRYHGENNALKEVSQPSEDRKEQYEKLFGTVREKPSQEQLDAVNKILGAEYIKSPSGLLAMFAEAEILFRARRLYSIASKVCSNG